MGGGFANGTALLDNRLFPPCKHAPQRVGSARSIRTDMYPIGDRLAVCSWSLQAPSPRALAEKVRATGITRLQLALDPIRGNPAVWAGTAAVLREAGIALVSGMFGCVGEDYTTLESIRVTGGIAPDPTWPQNLENIRATVEIAAGLGLPLVTFHAGFVPHDASDPGFAKMLERIGAIADLFTAAGIRTGLETGQESAGELVVLLEALRHPGVVVNFDPANMLLYGKGDPVAAVRLLAPWIGQVHIKDANPSPAPGVWGEEVPVGSGHVDWPAFLAALAAGGYTGDLVIEREAGNQRVADIRTAREVVLQSNR